MGPFCVRASGAWLACALFFSWGCESGGVGDPCVPEEEYAPDFSGFGVTEVNVESRSFQCETRVCLADHFQGRVSCPYGQSGDALKRDASDPSRCRLPGTSGEDPEDAVVVEVAAWDLDRPAKDTVYCSCRCAGPDPNARYCDCPSGFECRELVSDFGVGKNQLVGSYCVKAGNRFTARDVDGPTCADDPADPACPEPHGENP